MSKHTESQIAELEECLRKAMLKSDVAQLDRLIAPELIFTNHFGKLISKEEDLSIHRSGILQFTELTPSERYIQLNEGFSVVSVQMHLLGNYTDTAIDEHIRYTRVWSLSSVGSIQIIAGHASIVGN